MVAGLTAAVAALLIAVAASATVAALQFGLAASKEVRLRNEALSRAEAETVAKAVRLINWAHDQIPAIERTSRRSGITRRLTCSSRSKPSCPKTRAWPGCGRNARGS